MPAPLFLRLAYIREKNNLPLRTAADILEISQSYLYDLEEFVKAPDPHLYTGKSRLHDTVLNFLNTYGKHELFDKKIDWLKITSMAEKDQYFFSLMPHLQYVYITLDSNPTYSFFFDFFIRNILTTPKENIIYAPTDMTVAIMLNYAFSRLWANPSRRRKIMKMQEYSNIRYIPCEQQIEPGKPMGELQATDIRKALSFSDVYPDRRPYFAYLILYILTKKFYVNFESMDRDVDAKKWVSWLNKHSSMKYLDKIPDLPYRAALVINTKEGDITVFFYSLFNEGTGGPDIFIVKGDCLGSSNVI